MIHVGFTYGQLSFPDLITVEQESINFPAFTFHRTMDGQKTPDLVYSEYCGEKDLPAISKMVAERLSEPYSDFTYRYFFNNWPRLSFLVHDRARDNKLIGCVISKIDINSQEQRQGYIGMLAVDPEYRGQNIGTFSQPFILQECICLVDDTFGRLPLAPFLLFNLPISSIYFPPKYSHRLNTCSTFDARHDGTRC